MKYDFEEDYGEVNDIIEESIQDYDEDGLDDIIKMYEEES